MPRALQALVIGAVLALPASVAAQICTGSASFSQGPYQVTGGAAFTDATKSFVGGFAFGGVGPFAQLNIGTTSYDDLDGSTFTYGASAGYQFALGQKGTFHVCPMASIGFGSGPNDIDVFGDGSLIADLSETDLSFGLGLGALASQTGQTQIIPNVSLTMVSATAKISDDVSGDSESDSETFGFVGLGLGFVFNRVFTFQPTVAIPFGLEGASTTFGASLSVNFGRRAAR